MVTGCDNRFAVSSLPGAALAEVAPFISMLIYRISIGYHLALINPTKVMFSSTRK